MIQQPQVESIFGKAIEIEADGERNAFLDGACHGNSALRQQVDKLVHDYFRAGEFLEQPVAQIVSPTVDQPNTERPGTQIGPYKLLQQIGEGGMGSVYMAQQEKPVKRRVALKVIKAGMDSKLVIARFEAERQALALMDHPNIARLLDVGTTDTGRPYFVMELVKGTTITEYCDQKRLNVEQRLELFTSVCNAVQHAHQKGIIHRDLKPNNILITEYDEKVVPKIIDFGLAKALGQNLTDKTVFTQFGQVMGTLAYMSPEQSKVNALDIDTRADIYSLGVLLYELLTGSTPFDEKTLREAAFDQLLEIIREETPQKPSTRLSTSGTDPQIAPSRNTDLAKLGKLVRGDLDWIVMKALEKERSRRYDTANAFADDIDRYLKNEIIVARPPSARYKFGKFVKKNRGLVIASMLIAVSLIAAIIGTSIGLYQQGRIASQKIEFANQQAASDKEQLRQQTEFANEQKRLKEIADNRSDRADTAEYKSAWQEYVAKFKLAQAQWNYGDTTAAWNVLNSCRSDLRGWEYDFLYTKFTQNQLSLFEHTDPVNSVAFSPDGKQIVSASNRKKNVKVWNAITGEETITLKGHYDFLGNYTKVSCVAFSPDGKRIASGSGRIIKVWDSTSGEETLTLRGTGKVLSLAFSPDGKQIVSASYDQTVKVFNAVTGEETHTLKGHIGQVTSVAFSPDGTRIVSGGADKIIRVWNATTGQVTLKLTGHTKLVNSVTFSSDGTRIVSGSDDKTIRVWNAITGQEVHTLIGHTDRVTSASFSSDGTQIASGSVDKTIRVWNATTGEETHTLKGHVGPVTSVAFSPDGTRIVSGSNDKTIRVWNATDGQKPFTLRDNGHVYSIAFSPDGKQVVSACYDKTIRVWNAITGEETLALESFGMPVTSVAFSPDGKQIVGGGGGRSNRVLETIKIWNATSGVETRKFIGHVGRVYSVAFSSDGTRIISGGHDTTIGVWNAITGEEIHTLNKHTGGVLSVAFSPDGTRLVSGSADKTIKLWNAITGEEILTLKGHADSVTSVVFSPDGTQVASGSSDTTIKVWNAITGEVIHTLYGHTGGVSSVAFSPDGIQIASGSDDNTVKLWNAVAGQETVTLKGYANSVTSVAFSPDGTQIASGSFVNVRNQRAGVIRGSLNLWNANSGSAESLITRFDEDKDGKLSQAETENMLRPPSGADVNNDGFITRAELVESLIKQSKAANSRPKKDDDESRQASYERYVDGWMNQIDKDKDGKISQAETKQMRGLPKGADVNFDGYITREEFLKSLIEENKLPTSYPKKDDGQPQKSSQSNDESRQSRYERYVDAIMDDYDKDKDGKLSQAEFEKMRRPPVRADVNNDGYITRAELLKSLDGENGSSSR